MTLASLSRQRQESPPTVGRHCISSHSVALEILGLPTTSSTEALSIEALSEAYFNEAKKRRPDASFNKENFVELIIAYEYLFAQIGIGTTTSSNNQHLGISTELLVEECKHNPLFRKWLLLGHTNGAQYWQHFFLQNGGLEPNKCRSKMKLQTGRNEDDDSVRATRRFVRRKRGNRRRLSGAST